MLRGCSFPVFDGNVTSKLALIGSLNSSNLASQVANFVYEVRRIKESIVHIDSSNLVPLKSLSTDHKFSSEFAGTKKYTIKEIIEAKCNHGLVVNALAKELENRKFMIGNDRNRDIYFITHRGKIRAIFEIKTNTLSSSIYSAIGQLILYSIGVDKNTNLVLVIPDQLKLDIENKIKSIGLDILYYNWQGNKPVFNNLDDKL